MCKEGWFFVEFSSCIFAATKSMELWFLRQVAIHASIKCRNKVYNKLKKNNIIMLNIFLTNDNANGLWENHNFASVKY